MLIRFSVFLISILLIVLLIYCEDNNIEGRDSDLILTTTPSNYAYQIIGEVRDIDGIPISNVTVKLGDVSTTTLNDGRYVIVPNTTESIGTIKFSHPEYSPQIKNIPLDGKNSRTLSVNLKKWDVKGKLKNGNKNIVLTQSVKIDFPKNTKFIKSDKTVITADPEINICSINPSDKEQRKAFPGDFSGVRSNGSTTSIESIGLFKLEMNSNGENINIDSSTPVEVTFKIPNNVSISAGSTIPLWWFNETTGLWVEDGSANVQTDSNGELIAKGSVSHFTYWNCDMPNETTCIKGKISLPEGSNVPIWGIRIETEGVDYNGNSSSYSDTSGNFCINVKNNSQYNLTAYSYVYSSNGVNYRLELSPVDASLFTPATSQATIMNCFSNQGETSSCLDIGTLHMVEATTNLSPTPPPPPPPPPPVCLKGTVVIPSQYNLNNAIVQALEVSSSYIVNNVINSDGSFCINVSPSASYNLSFIIYDSSFGNYLASVQVDNPNIIYALGSTGNTCQSLSPNCNDVGTITISQVVTTTNCFAEIKGNIYSSLFVSSSSYSTSCTLTLVSQTTLQTIATDVIQILTSTFAGGNDFLIQNVPIGNYLLNINAPLHYTVDIPVIINACATIDLNTLTLSPSDLSPGDMRITHNKSYFGSSAFQDMHIVFPDPNNYPPSNPCLTTGRGHIYEFYPGDPNVSPYILYDSPFYQELLIKDSAFDALSLGGIGIFKLSVFDHNNQTNPSSTELGYSNVTMFVYDSTGLLKIININNHSTPNITGNLWKVLTIDPVTRAITEVNEIDPANVNGQSNNCTTFDW